VKKLDPRQRRKRRIRKKISGTAERPRLCVFKSSRHMQAQIIDDTRGVTLASASTLSKELRGESGYPGNVESAKRVGALIGRVASERDIKQVVFDRGGYPYHGRVKALADAAREAGLEF
jgi:large subunit ribosomal protein L18